MDTWPIICKFILKFKKLFEMSQERVQERVQMICGQYQAKSSASRHRKKCIPCKTVIALKERIKKIEKGNALLLKLTDILRKHQIILENDISQEILELSNASFFESLL